MCLGYGSQRTVEGIRCDAELGGGIREVEDRCGNMVGAQEDLPHTVNFGIDGFDPVVQVSPAAVRIQDAGVCAVRASADAVEEVPLGTHGKTDMDAQTQLLQRRLPQGITAGALQNRVDGTCAEFGSLHASDQPRQPVRAVRREGVIGKQGIIQPLPLHVILHILPVCQIVGLRSLEICIGRQQPNRHLELVGVETGPQIVHVLDEIRQVNRARVVRAVGNRDDDGAQRIGVAGLEQIAQLGDRVVAVLPAAVVPQLHLTAPRGRQRRRQRLRGFPFVCRHNAVEAGVLQRVKRRAERIASLPVGRIAQCAVRRTPSADQKQSAGSDDLIVQGLQIVPLLLGQVAVGILRFRFPRRGFRPDRDDCRYDFAVFVRDRLTVLIGYRLHAGFRVFSMVGTALHKARIAFIRVARHLVIRVQ